MEDVEGCTSVEQQRRVVTAIPGPRSQALQRRRERAVGGAAKSLLPIAIRTAGGGVLLDEDGNSLIDFASGIAVTSVGNSNPMIVNAITEQAKSFTHTCFAVTAYEPYIALCEKLNAHTPGSFEKRTILQNTGAEAVEAAVKIARYWTNRNAIVVFDHAYHGRSNLTMTMTAADMPYRKGFGVVAPEIYRVPTAYPFRWPTGPANCATEAAAAVIDRMERQIGVDRIAAVVAEPILGEGGFIVPAPGFLPAIRQFCADNGIVYISDEVQTGMGRTGDWFASEHEDLQPDLVTTAKALAGGLPLSAVTGRAEIMDAVHPGGMGGTYSGNPLACAAALAVFSLLEEKNLVGRARNIGEIMIDRLTRLARVYDCIGDVRGRGAMTAIEIVRPGSRDPDPAMTQKVMAECHRNGLLVLVAGTYNNVLRFLPPLVIPATLLDEGLDILARAFQDAA